MGKRFFYGRLLILTIPSFTVYIGWTATHEIPLVLNLSFFAGLMLLKVLDKKENVILPLKTFRREPIKKNLSFNLKPAIKNADLIY